MGKERHSTRRREHQEEPKIATHTQAVTWSDVWYSHYENTLTEIPSYRDLSCTMDTTLTNQCQTESNTNLIVLLIVMCYNVVFQLSDIVCSDQPVFVSKSAKMAVSTCCQSACLQSWGKSSGKRKGSCQLGWDILKLWLCHSCTTISQNLSMASLLSSHHKV